MSKIDRADEVGNSSRQAAAALVLALTLGLLSTSLSAQEGVEKLQQCTADPVADCVVSFNLTKNDLVPCLCKGYTEADLETAGNDKKVKITKLRAVSYAYGDDVTVSTTSDASASATAAATQCVYYNTGGGLKQVCW
ncbi:MAG TPA: hypothetical protein VFG43_12935 [Geminicoccaceae bacterium]|nr:hypothetical protein [Geminicoccaceae bacterium]